MKKQIICKVCGEFKELGGNGMCKKCYDKKYRSENKEARSEYSRKWWLENKKKKSAIHKKYRLRNKEKVILAIKKWQKANPEKLKACRKRYYAKNPEKVKAGIKKWQKANPEKVRENWLRKRGYGIVKKGIINKVITENILKYGSIVCEKCKEKCPDNFHIDHIMPISKGGPNNYNNLQILCAHCNCSKHVDIADYRQINKNNQMFLKTSGR